ncbi:MAG: c-type cytochrome [Phycisphaerales bacterium]|nr:c-type cytochrome [Phycisphaerales bacterium]
MMQTLASAQPDILQKMFFGETPAPSEAAAWSDGLFLMITWFSIFFFVVLMALMVYFVIKYRRRPGVPAQISPHHNLHIEILWTVIPSAGMLVMFVYGFQGYAAKIVSPDNALELKIQGSKWSWIATYPNGATSPETQALSKIIDNENHVVTQGKEYPIFYVPEDTAIKLRMHSTDVIHSFWIPEFRTKMDVIPNRYTGYGFHTPKLTASDTVVYYDAETKQDSTIVGRDMWIFCAEYCGDDHSRMAATLRIVPREVYDQRMADWSVKLSPIDAGEKLWTQICKSCHQVDGTKLVGPTWNSVKNSDGQFGFGYEAALENGSSAMRDANYYRESILDPNAKIVKGFAPAMTSYQGQLSEEDIDNIIAYIQSLSDRNPNAGEDTGTSTEAPESDADTEAAGSHS